MKKQPKNYRKVDFLTIKDIQKEAEQLVLHNKYKTYTEELSYVLDSFLNLLKNAKYQGGTENFYNTYQYEVEKTINNIKNCVHLFLKGEIFASYNSFNRRWQLLWREKINKSSAIMALKGSRVWYKLRSLEDNEFARKDFFHVPLDKRGKIDNNRFSISGFPCLYLGGSLYTCWEELRRPKLNEMAAVGFIIEKEIQLLDLRLITPILTTNEESNNILLLPYILASSIRVHSEGDHFKPEYIIPQLLLHSVIKKGKKSSYKYDGIIYTSTRRNFQYPLTELSLYDNIAIPVMNTRYKRYDKTLASFFKETEPFYFEHELLKGHIHGSNSISCLKYENTAFQEFENIINDSNTFAEIVF